MVSEIMFIFSLELINHQKFHSKVASRDPKGTPTTATHDKPSTVLDSVRHEDTCMALHGATTARNRGSYDDAVLIR